MGVTEGLELAGRYVVGHQIGAGGAGSVWKAHDQVLDRPVAVKVVPEGVAAARLAREARATAGIGVRNVVAVYDVGEQDGAHFLVMEYVDGVDLGTLLAVTGPLEPDLAAIVGRDVARGIAAVHDAELVHRDVTPANVLVTVEGEVKLTDLGIAQRTGEEATRRLTEMGTVVGTVDYLAPEQVEGHDVSGASDVYSAGLLLHTASTGRPPFGDGSVSERLARRLATDPAQLGADSGALGEVIATAVQRDPKDRYRDGHALRAALSALVPDDESALRQRLADRVGQAAAAGEAVGSVGAGGAVAGGPTTDAVEGIAIAAHRPGPAPAAAPTPERDVRPAEPDAPASPPPDRTEVVSTTGAAPERPPGGRSADAGPGRRGLFGPIVAAVFGVMVVVGVVSAVLNGDGRGDGGDSNDGDGATAVSIAAVEDHDPLGGGGEHGDEVGRVVDGDPESAWDTEGYNSPDLGGLKDGVGLLLDLEQVVDVAAVELDLGLDGVDLVVTVSEERPEGDPTASATVLGSASGAEGTVRIEGEETVAGRWVAVWFTSLAPDGGRFRAAISEVRVLAP